jgi:hypothetical protein
MSSSRWAGEHVTVLLGDRRPFLVKNVGTNSAATSKWLHELLTSESLRVRSAHYLLTPDALTVPKLTTTPGELSRLVSNTMDRFIVGLNSALASATNQPVSEEMFPVSRVMRRVFFTHFATARRQNTTCRLCMEPAIP